MPIVFLVDPLVCIAKLQLYMDIQRQLQGYFDRVGKAMHPPQKITVGWIPATPTVTPQDLLVYFTSTDYSVVSRLAGNKFDPLAVSHWGFTDFRMKNGVVTIAGSEVYTKSLQSDVLAKLAFHELMHNKLTLGNEMHSHGGLAQATVGPQTDITQRNIAEMAAAMPNAVPQWTDGVAMMVAARLRREAHDPLWYL